MIEELAKIFEDNKDKRICVLGTTCTGKTTIINNLHIGEDMDELIFPLLSKEEEDYVCQTPWTPEIGAKMDELVKERLVIQAGAPLFGTVLLDADLIIYLHISDELLWERSQLRNVDFADAKNMQTRIEAEIKRSGINYIVVEAMDLYKENVQSL